jgi:alpha-ketoglutarate-dependent dioxygenase alkB family protein 2
MQETRAESNAIVMKDFHVGFYPQFYSSERCEEIITVLKKLRYNSDTESQVLIRGEYKNIPRKQVAFADPEVRSYRFSGTSVEGKVWPRELDDLRNELNNFLISQKILDEGSQRLNYLLVNYYRDGNDYIGYHSDDERDLEIPLIVSLSFGETRDFIFQNVKAPGIAYPIELGSGDLLIIHPPTNKAWKHSLPKRTTVKGARFNLTFRIMKLAD